MILVGWLYFTFDYIFHLLIIVKVGNAGDM